MSARLVIAVIAFGAVFASIVAFGRHERAAGRAEVQQQWDRAAAIASAAAASAAADNLIESQRRIDAQQELARAAQRSIAQAQANAAAADRAAQQLRQRFAAALAASRSAPGDPAAATGSPAADAAADLLADVQRRIDEAAGGIGRFADAAHIAGATCERSYEALSGHVPAVP